QADDRCSMISPRFQISLVTLERWRSVPFTCSQISAFAMSPASAAGVIGPMGADCSKLLPISQGRPCFFISPCRSRRVLSRPQPSAPVVLLRIGALDVAPARADRGDELDLVMRVLGEAGVVDAARLTRRHGDDGIGGLEEEERRLAAGEAHFLGVFDVVAAHA